MRYFGAILTVRKTIYLDDDLDEALKEVAAREGRSVTKQIHHMLLNGLADSQQGHPHAVYGGKRTYAPDAKQKAPRRRSRA